MKQGKVWLNKKSYFANLDYRPLKEFYYKNVHLPLALFGSGLNKSTMECSMDSVTAIKINWSKKGKDQKFLSNDQKRYIFKYIKTVLFIPAAYVYMHVLTDIWISCNGSQDSAFLCTCANASTENNAATLFSSVNKNRCKFFLYCRGLQAEWKTTTCMKSMAPVYHCCIINITQPFSNWCFQ